MKTFWIFLITFISCDLMANNTTSMDIKQLRSNLQFIDKETAKHHIKPGYEIDDYIYSSGLIGLIEGDVLLDGDLYLDFDDLYADFENGFWFDGERRIDGLIVKGDLIINGSVINANGDYGPFLMIDGSLKAQHGVFGGSVVHIMKGAIFDGLVYAHYNHGIFSVKDNFSASLFINSDHDFDVHLGATPYFEYKTSNFGLPLSAYLHESFPVGLEEDDLEYEVLSGVDPETQEYVETHSAILSAIESHQPVLKQQQPTINKDSWLFAAIDNPYKLKDVPQEYLSDEFYLQVVQKNGYALRYVPDSEKNLELIQAALSESVYAIEYVPEQLLTLELYNLALANGTAADVFRDIPETFKRKHPEICLDAIEEDADMIEYVPEDLITEELLEKTIESYIQQEHSPYTLLRVLSADKFTEKLALKIGVNFPYSIKSLPSSLVTAELLLDVLLAGQDLPNSLMNELEPEIKHELRRLQGVHAEKNAVLFKKPGFSFKHSQTFEVIAEHKNKKAQSYALEFDNMMVVLAVVPNQPQYSLESFIKKNQRTQKWSEWGQKMGRFIYSREWPKFENSNQPVAPYDNGFSGYAYHTEQELVKDILTIKKVIQYLSKDFGDQLVIATFEYLLDKEDLISSERDLILSSVSVE